MADQNPTTLRDLKPGDPVTVLRHGAPHHASKVERFTHKRTRVVLTDGGVYLTRNGQQLGYATTYSAATWGARPVRDGDALACRRLKAATRALAHGLVPRRGMWATESAAFYAGRMAQNGVAPEALDAVTDAWVAAKEARREGVTALLGADASEVAR